MLRRAAIRRARPWRGGHGGVVRRAGAHAGAILRLSRNVRGFGGRSRRSRAVSWSPMTRTASCASMSAASPSRSLLKGILLEALGVPKQFTGKAAKTDIEGAAAIGNRIYWITGHAERWRTQRLFFATDFLGEGGTWDVKPVGTPYRSLREDLLGDKATVGYIDGPRASRTATRAKGFNIEGLGSGTGWKATADRSAQSGGRRARRSSSLLENPNDVLLKGVPPKFGKIIALALDGQRHPQHRPCRRPLSHRRRVRQGRAGPLALLVVRRSQGQSRRSSAIASALPGDDFRPEALFAIPGTDKVQLLGDDGNVDAREAECRKAPQEDKKLRSIIITP